MVTLPALLVEAPERGARGELVRSDRQSFLLVRQTAAKLQLLTRASGTAAEHPTLAVEALGRHSSPSKVHKVTAAS